MKSREIVNMNKFVRICFIGCLLAMVAGTVLSQHAFFNKTRCTAFYLKEKFDLALADSNERLLSFEKVISHYLQVHAEEPKIQMVLHSIDATIKECYRAFWDPLQDETLSSLNRLMEESGGDTKRQEYNLLHEKGIKYQAKVASCQRTTVEVLSSEFVPKFVLRAAIRVMATQQQFVEEHTPKRLMCSWELL